MKRPLLLGLLTLLCIVAGSFSLIGYLTGQEEQRTRQQWEITLRSLADQQGGQIGLWLQTQQEQLTTISQNDSMRLYIQRLLEQQDEGQTELAQLAFIRNMMINSARQLNYEPASSEIGANIRQTAGASLGFYSSGGRLLSGNAGDQLSQSAVLKTFQQVVESQSSQISPVWQSEGVSLIAIIVPIMGLPAFNTEATMLGAIVGIKPFNQTIDPLLRNSILSIDSLESAIAQTEDERSVFITPLRDGSQPFSRTVTLPDHLLQQAGSSMVDGQNYEGRNTLLVSHLIPDTSLQLLVQVSRSEALKDSQVYEAFIQTLVILAALLILALIYAAWWYGQVLQHSRTNSLISEQKNRIAYQSTLLSAINDNISDAILITDQHRNTLFINKTLADKLMLNADDANGKSIAALLGSNYADQLEPLIEQAITQQQSITEEQDLTFRDTEGHFHITAVPIEYQQTSAAMVTLHDITSAARSQKQQSELQQQIITSLMNAIDLHDPYSANHSAKTSVLAWAIAEEMQLNKADTQTLRVAANLCNLGKLFIPKELLVKTGPLTDEEKETIQSEVIHTHRILEGITFDGPVMETILQKYEYLDGSGNAGMMGDEISHIARILIVANDFVAMISPRAYRNHMEPRQALDIIYQLAETKYDRRVIASLFHIVENRMPDELLNS